MEQEKYIPGVCNIGPDERRLRKLGGWVGIGLFIALFGILYFTGAPHWARLFLFLPAITAATGWVQYKNHFCVNFGMRGLRNLDKPAFQTENVIEAEYKKKRPPEVLEVDRFFRGDEPGRHRHCLFSVRGF